MNEGIAKSLSDLLLTSHFSQVNQKALAQAFHEFPDTIEDERLIDHFLEVGLDDIDALKALVTIASEDESEETIGKNAEYLRACLVELGHLRPKSSKNWLSSFIKKHTN